MISSPILPLPASTPGEQVVHAGDDGLERLQQVGALRHQLGNVLALLAAQLGAGLHRARVLAARDVDELVAQQVGGGDGRHGIHRDVGQKLRLDQHVELDRALRIARAGELAGYPGSRP